VRLKKKGACFAAGTRTLVDRELLRRRRATPMFVGIFLCAFDFLKAGHDNHLHHSEPIFEQMEPASFLAYGLLIRVEDVVKVHVLFFNFVFVAFL